MDHEQRRQDLATFLRTRRMRLAPEHVGLPGGGRRRTPGLRREEVAQLANVGVSWYTLLEQGRDIHPSRNVLQAIADALQLTPVEQRYLFELADPQPRSSLAAADEQVSPALRHVLDALNPLPAYLIGRRWNYLAWNAAAGAVLRLPHESLNAGYNAIWRIFAAPASQRINVVNWEQSARKVLAEFRVASVPYTHEAWFTQLVAELERVSPEFRAWWPQQDIRVPTDPRKVIEDPLVGRLMFEPTALQVPAMPELKLMIYTPLPETDTLEKLQQLLRRGEDSAREEGAASREFPIGDP